MKSDSSKPAGTLAEYGPLGFLILIALVTRLAFAETNGIWFDEAIVVHRVTQSMSDMIAMIRVGDNCPPVHYLILQAYTRIFGTHPQWVIEIPSIAISVVGIVYAYRAGKEMFSSETGLIAAALLTVSSYYLKFSWEIRVYALMGTLSLASTYYMFRFLRAPTSIAPIIGFVVASALNVNTHFFAFFTLLAQNLYILGLNARRVPIRKWILAQGAIGLLFLPWAFVFLSQLDRVTGGEFWIPPLSPSWFIGQLFQLVSFNFQIFIEDAISRTSSVLLFREFSLAAWTTIGVFVLFILLGIRRLFDKEDRSATLYWFLHLFLPIAAVAVLSITIRPLFLQRYFTGAMPGLALIGAIGLRSFPRSLVIVATATLLLLGGIDCAIMLKKPHEPGPRRIARFLEESTHRDDLIVFLSPYYYFPIQYYNPDQRNLRLFIEEGGWTAMKDQMPAGAILDRTNVLSAIEGVKKLYIVDGYYFNEKYKKKIVAYWPEWLGLDRSKIKKLRRAGPEGWIYTYE